MFSAIVNPCVNQTFLLVQINCACGTVKTRSVVPPCSALFPVLFICRPAGSGCRLATDSYPVRPSHPNTYAWSISVYWPSCYALRCHRMFIPWTGLERVCTKGSSATGYVLARSSAHSANVGCSSEKV